MTGSATLLEICRALTNNEFDFYFQPIISLVTGRVTGAEALIRWIQPDGTVRPPGEFIPVAVEHGFITEITREMFPRVASAMSKINQLDPELQVTFNLTGQDLATPGMIGTMVEVLKARGVQPSRLMVEIVEDVLFPPNSNVQASIGAMAAAGIPLSLDDFSAGHTSVEYLSQLPLKILKLATTIVKRSTESAIDFRVLRHLVSLGHQLRLDVVAEGVEDHEIYDLVLSTGASYAQGFYLAHPMPLSRFIEFAAAKRQWVSYPFGLEYLAQIDHIDVRRDVIREALIVHTHADPQIRARAKARLPFLDESACILGKWMRVIEQAHGASPEFTRLQESHKSFHAAADALLEAVSSNRDWDAVEAMIGDLTQISGEIMSRLQSLSTNKLIQNYQV
jgi:EAL domain-containing protein (putative c-di-GMP-specific phosphodiesterase class I)